MPGKYQSRPNFCAPASLQCALACLGVRVGQGKLAAAIGVTEDGADEQDLMGAIAALGFRPDPFESSCKGEARTWLQERASFHPMILCVDDWGHWVTLAGQCHDRYFLFDPAKAPWNTCARGSWPLRLNTILRRWRASKATAGRQGSYYGIGVLPA